ncbi:MAG: signal peptidase II [Candidatus Woesearchaeota archaeon]
MVKIDIKKLFIISLIIIILDQLTKIITKNIDFEIFSFFGFIYTTNTGAAFGIFKEQTTLILFLSIMIIGALIYFIPQIEKENYLGYSLLLGGAIGNLIDRIFLGYVRDFISIWIWPVFNIADIAISIGIILIIINEIKKEIK